MPSPTNKSEERKKMRTRSAPKSGGSYTNGNGQDVPSYMSSTPPSSAMADVTSGTSNGHDLEARIKTMKRRRPTVTVKQKARDNACTRIYSYIVDGEMSAYAALLLAIVLWYILGVLSIGTTKILLTDGVPPLYLTIQQLLLGSNLLRFLLSFRALGSTGLVPWPKETQLRTPSRRSRRPESFWEWHLRDLVLAGVYFALGFAATNLSFSGASAAFVETIKAAEPITSAATAVSWGLEVLSIPETASLGTIVMGVLLSTLGNANHAGSDGGSTLSTSIRSCMTVMIANLCFSFRGLHQKLFRALPHGSKTDVDDLNLQFRMQQVGIGLLLIPVLLWDSRTLFALFFSKREMKTVLHYVGLSVLNGFAFTSYNLASTFVLTRVSVVHHAALNCIRRIFAIIITSIAFSIPITLVGATGIMVSFGGFIGFTHFKMKRQQQPKPISTLLPMSAA